MRSMIAALAAPALLVPLLAIDVAQAASTWSVPKGVDVELSTGTVGAITPGRSGAVFVSGSFVTSNRSNPAAFSIGLWRNGTLTPVTGSPTGAISALAYDAPRKTLYAGGSILIGSTMYGVVKWDGTAWSGVADTEFGLVNALAVDSDGTLYVGGDFQKVNGQTGFRNFAQYSTTGWSSLGSNFDDAVTSIAVDRRDRVYVGGYFTRWSPGQGTVGSVAVWNRDSWSVSGATNGHVLTVAIGPGDVLYGHGTFTEASGVEARLARIAPADSEWQAVPAPPAEITPFGASQMSFTPDGALIMGIDGGVYSFKGASWTTIPGVFGGPIRTVVSDTRGSLIAGGSFTTVDGVRTPGLAGRSSAQPPAAPQTVNAEAMSRRILVQWSAVASTPAVTRYEAECRRGVDGPTQKLAVTGRFANFDVARAGTYRCKVRAQNAAGWGPWSRAVPVTVR